MYNHCEDDMMTFFPVGRLILPVIALALLAGCSGNDDIPLESFTAEEIYHRADGLRRGRDFEDAAKMFEEIERLYPYSEWARRGTVMAAYSYGLAEDYDASRAAAQRFLHSYPGDEEAAYAQYLVAMSYFEQIDKRGRDQAITENATRELETLIKEYGDSDYARTASLKFDLMHNHRAAKEMEVGRYYLKGGHYASAINRFQTVITVYETTSFVPEALHRMVEAYLSLGLVEEARETAAILGYNYQGNEWYEDSHRLFTSRQLAPPSAAEREGLLRQFYRRTIKGEWL